MADVMQGRDADRAQLFLVGALSLAVIFVALAVLLNTAIYTGNIATRDPGPGTTEVVEYEGAAVDMADRTLANVNRHNNSSYTDLQSTFNDTVAVWSDTANVHSTTSLADANVSTAATVRGTKVGQDTERNFTDADGNDDWLVANDSRARAFRMNVSQPSLIDIADLTDSFYVAFDDGENEFRAYVSREGTDNVSVEVRNATADSQLGATCSADAGSDDHVLVEPTAGRLGGTPCPAFTMLFANLSTPYDVRYNNTLEGGGETISGTYQVIVNRSVDQLQTGADETGGAPYAAPALYSAELRVSYQSSVIYYRSEPRVAPEESDA